MKRILPLLAILLGSALARGEGPPSGRWFDPGLGRPIEIPAAIRNSDHFAQLAYKQGENPRGVRVDLDDDGTEDYILIDAGEYCGTGGCPYKLFDGRSLREIGNLFGDPLILSQTRVNAFLVLHTYAHLNAGSGTYSPYVFDGADYKTVSSLLLTTDSVDKLFEEGEMVHDTSPASAPHGPNRPLQATAKRGC